MDTFSKLSRFCPFELVSLNIKIVIKIASYTYPLLKISFPSREISFYINTL